MFTALDIITGALQEINAIAQGEQPEPGDVLYALGKLNDLTDEWAARKCFIYDLSFPVYTLVPGLQPATVGPMVLAVSSSRVNNVATYIAKNDFSNGDNVTVFGSTNGLNTTGRVQLATSSQFSIAFVGANVASALDTAGAIIAGATAPTYATPNLGQRPQRLEQANIILNNSSPTTDIPMNVRDSDWWMNQRVKNISSSVPTDVYYEPSFPNGSLYFWPLPSTAYQVRLKFWGTVPQFPTLNTQFRLPPGYLKALKLDLASDLVGPFQAPWSPNQAQARMRAIKAVQSNNVTSPRGVTMDAGMPSNNNRSDFNWQSGMPSKS